MIKKKKNLLKKCFFTIFFSLSYFRLAWFLATDFPSTKIYVFAFSLTLYLFVSCLLIYYSINSKELYSEIDQEIEKGDAGDYYLVGIPTLFCIFFICTTFSIWSIWNKAFVIGPINKPYVWLGFLFDNIIRAALLDFAEIFYIQISSIQHSKNFFVCLLIFSFRTVLSLYFISYIIRVWKKLRSLKRA